MMNSQVSCDLNTVDEKYNDNNNNNKYNNGQ